MDVVEKDFEDLGAQNWREIVQDQDKWSNLVMTAINSWIVMKARRIQ